MTRLRVLVSKTFVDALGLADLGSMPKDTSFSLAVTCMKPRKFGSLERVGVSDQFVRNGSSLSTYARVAVQTP